MEAVIIGCGHTKFGRLAGKNLEDLISEVVIEALQSSGIDGSDIDAVYLGNFNAGMTPDCFASTLALNVDSALRFKPCVRLENACASGSAAIYSAIDAIEAGRLKNVLVIGAEKMTDLSTPEVGQALAKAGYYKENNLNFPQVFSLFAKKYFERYGDHSYQLAQIASKNHRNSLTNKYAHLQRDLSVDFCNTISDKNPMISDPLRMSDCSLVSDGAAAIVLSAKEYAPSQVQKVKFRSRIQVNDFLPMAKRDYLSFLGPKLAFKKAYHEAGVTVHDIDFAEIHDCFTIAELLTYEAMGLASDGQGKIALDEGVVYPGGDLVVNRSGGLKAKGHPVGATGVSMHAICYKQLTNTAMEMQLPKANLGLCFNMGGSAVANYVSILESCGDF